MTQLVLLTAFIFPQTPAVQAEGRVIVKGIKIGLVSVRRAEIDYTLMTDGTLRATGKAILAGDVTAKIVHLSGDTVSGRYVCVLDVFGGRVEAVGRLADILKQLLPE